MKSGHVTCLIMLLVYHCGCSSAWSSLFTFTAMPTRSDWGPRFAIFGDMGYVNAKSVGRLTEETQAGHFDAMLHVGMSTCYCYYILYILTLMLIHPASVKY